MAFHASSWLPWIFFGPLLVAIVSGTAYQLTREPLLATVAQAALALCLLAGTAAFIAARHATKRKASADEHDAR